MTEREIRDLIEDMERWWRGLVNEATHPQATDHSQQMFWWLDKLRDSLPMSKTSFESVSAPQSVERLSAVEGQQAKLAPCFDTGMEVTP